MNPEIVGPVLLFVAIVLFAAGIVRQLLHRTTQHSSGDGSLLVSVGMIVAQGAGVCMTVNGPAWLFWGFLVFLPLPLAIETVFWVRKAIHDSPENDEQPEQER